MANEKDQDLGGIRRMLAVFLALACVGVLVQIFTGVPYPKVPPGPIILAVAALLVAVVRWRWMPVLGLLVALFLSVGAVASGTTLPRLAEPAWLGPFAGTWLQILAQLAAIAAGLAGILAASRKTRTGTAAPFSGKR
ncbi:hypothetical protein ORV05_12345 [Amycolatopsis cynarae]|uniref:Uncharacterized protein n=1 Tax=Amycolatopsis cynarae TaxID=2995223 RepID=A0ABY7BCA8_9PSEU|nr:hypothetical protein [Amycolatopsis sp. HUAS 11-8]WAL68521.1 hypothetical protein ORV05_12345 [Amycolatopsis sp. HUAS 11-8]